MHARSPSLLALGTLILLAGVPAVLGHDDSGSRYPGSVDDGVAGTYVGAARPVPPWTGTGYAIRNEFDPAYVNSPTGFYHAVCDLEVGGDGSSPQAQDESVVDGGAGGSVPDGTWDDGGYGGACHTEAFYGQEPYNSPGCVANTARASDAVAGGSVWIGAGCDAQTTVGNISFCGADGEPEAINFATGGAGAAFPVSQSCAQADVAMMVFVFDYGGVQATRGVIWSET